MKSFLESFLENHKYYHSGGMNPSHWESKYDQLAARAQRELGSKPFAESEPDGIKVRESSLDDIPEDPHKIDRTLDAPAEYSPPKESTLF
jgi:hypothetical protein